MLKVKEKNLIIGCGTGRCGTVSLSDLLRRQGINSSHEHMLMPWDVDMDKFNQNLNSIMKRHEGVVADTAFYYLPYLEIILNRIKNVKIVILKRDMEGTVASFEHRTTLRKNINKNHWVKGDEYFASSIWFPCFPTYDDMTSKTEAIQRYWTEYYEKAGELVKKYPDRVKIFGFRYTLNTEKGQIELAKFLQIPKFVIHLDICMNKSKR